MSFGSRQNDAFIAVRTFGCKTFARLSFAEDLHKISAWLEELKTKNYGMLFLADALHGFIKIILESGPSPRLTYLFSSSGCTLTRSTPYAPKYSHSFALRLIKTGTDHVCSARISPTRRTLPLTPQRITPGAKGLMSLRKQAQTTTFSFVGK